MSFLEKMILFQKVYKVSKRMLTFQIHFWNSIEDVN